MAASASLPRALHDRLTAVARRIRLMRLIYGLSLLLLVLTLTGAACLLLDYLGQLSSVVRLGLLLGWVGLGLLTALFAVVLPLCRRLDPASLAAFVEERYPELAERLTSAVELSSERGLHHGSPALIDLLLADAADHTDRLRVTRAVRAGLVAAVAVTAAVVLIAVLAPAAFWPGVYANLGTRFLAPWYTPPVVLDYAVESLSGDVFAARGRPLTLSARVLALEENASLPSDCVLIVSGADGGTQRLTMTPSRDGDSYFASFPELKAGFDYHVESGQAKTETFTVIAVEPVALAPDSPTITVTAPEYARHTIQEKMANGLVNLTALQHSRVKLELKFTQPVKWAVLGRPGDDAKGSNPIDHFIRARLIQAGLPAAESDRGKLLERVTLDLVGLPPTAEEMAAFTNDKSADAYEKVVDRLLASPQYAERRGRHWLDLARFADNGKDGTKPSYGYRDYIIQTINGDKPYDQAALERLALDCSSQPMPVAGQKGFRLSVRGFDPEAMTGLLASLRDLGDVLQPIPLADDGLSGTVELDAVVNGPLRLVLVDQYGIDTRIGPIALTVNVDQPPAFHKVTLSDQLKAVLPTDRVPLDFLVVDDVGVEGALLEYQVNGGPVLCEVIPLTGANNREAMAKHFFALSGKVKEGDELKLRLKAMDNRRLPEKNLLPQEVYYPAQDRWLTLKVASAAKPVKEQEITGQRDEVNKKLDKIQDDLMAEQRGVYKLRQEAKNDTALRPENLTKLKDLRQENRTVEDELRELARDAANTPELQKIADASQNLADQEMHRSADGLRQAEKGNQPQPREEKLEKVDDELGNALAKIAEMRKANNQLAQQRLDQTRLEAAAQKEKDLADRTADLANKDPMKDPDARNQAKELQKEQNDLANDLQKLAEQSDALRNGLDRVRGEQAKELAEQAKELAKQERELAEMSKQDDPQRQQQLAELARKQQQLADKAVQLAKETQSAAKAAQTNPLKPEDAQKAAENLKNGDAGEAVKNQDQAAKDLDRLADHLDKALDLAKDPREAARQLARMEQGLQQRLNDELAKKNDPKALAERLAELQKEQDAIRKATDQLNLPEQNRQAQTDRKTAANRATDAVQALKSPTPRNATSQMEQARQALEELAKDLPSLEQRQKAARDAVAQLRQQQENTNQLAEQALKPFEKDDPNAAKTRQQLAEKLAEAMRKQAEAAEKLSRLDAPGFEQRQEKAEQALNQALRDLLDARPQDVPASQQAAKRELERLEQALQGKTPADEQAQKLAERQQKLLEEAAKTANDPKATPQQVEELKKKQQELARETQNLLAPEAPQRQDEAAKATKQAEQAANKNPAAPEALKKMQDAAKALQQLAEQMSGQEPEAAKAERLARKQAEAAADAERLAKKQQPVDPDAPQQLQRRNQEAKELRGGDEAQSEKQKALEALKRAQQAKPEEQPKAQRQAADALRDLADKLAGRNTPADKAAELARQQRELAKEADKADGQPSPDRQQELARQLDRLDAKGAEDARRQAGEKMEKARQALEQATKPAEAKEQLSKAADAAEKLAKELGDKQAAQQKPANQPQQQAAKPGDSPQKLAQELANKQKELANQTQKARDDLGWFPGESDKKQFQKALDKINEQQQQLNKQASQLPADGMQKTLEQAREQMNQAQQSLEKKDGYQAQAKQREAADTLQRLAHNLPQQQPNNAQAQQPQQSPLNKQQTEQARDLAQQQRELRDMAQKLAQQPSQNQAQQQEKQQNLEKKANDLMQDLQKLAQQMDRQPQAQKGAEQAAQQAQQAQNQMQQARNQGQQGNQGQQQQAQQQAAQSLEQAARQAQQSGQQMKPQQGDPPGQQPGQAVQQAQSQMQQAQKQLGQGQPQNAQNAMQQAAQMLKQAAEQLGQQSQQQAQNQPSQPMQNGEPGPLGASGEGRVDASMLSPDMKKYAGKRWGELPGELQTKILQDMKARYGDDYARIIKLYFEQLADTKRK